MIEFAEGMQNSRGHGATAVPCSRPVVTIMEPAKRGVVIERMKVPGSNGFSDTLFIIGTAHMCRSSAREAKCLVQCLRPAALLVELDKTRLPQSQLASEHRLAILHRPGGPRGRHNFDWLGMCTTLSLPTCLLAGVLSSAQVLQAACGALAIAGRDIIGALQVALQEDLQTHVFLGDRPAVTTLARAAAQTGLWSIATLLPAAISGIGGSYDVYGYRPTGAQLLAWCWALARGDWPAFAAACDAVVRRCNRDPDCLLHRIRAVRPDVACVVDEQHELVLRAAAGGSEGMLPRSRQRLFDLMEAEGTACLHMPPEVYGVPPESPEVNALLALLPPPDVSGRSPAAAKGAKTPSSHAQRAIATAHRPVKLAESLVTLRAHYPSALTTERDLLLADAIARMPAAWRQQQARQQFSATGIAPLREAPKRAGAASSTGPSGSPLASTGGATTGSVSGGQIFMAVVGCQHVPGILRVLGASAAARPADCSAPIFDELVAKYPALRMERTRSVAGSPFEGHEEALDRLNRVPVAPFVLQTLLPLALLFLLTSLPFLSSVSNWIRCCAGFVLVAAAAVFWLFVWRVRQYWARLRQAFASHEDSGKKTASSTAASVAIGSRRARHHSKAK